MAVSAAFGVVAPTALASIAQRGAPLVGAPATSPAVAERHTIAHVERTGKTDASSSDGDVPSVDQRAPPRLRVGVLVDLH